MCPLRAGDYPSPRPWKQMQTTQQVSAPMRRIQIARHRLRRALGEKKLIKKIPQSTLFSSSTTFDDNNFEYKINMITCSTSYWIMCRGPSVPRAGPRSGSKTQLSAQIGMQSCCVRRTAFRKRRWRWRRGAAGNVYCMFWVVLYLVIYARMRVSQRHSCCTQQCDVRRCLD